MTARLYALANQKGGVGKSTTAVNVAGYLGEWGHRTLVVDLDPQGNATSGLGVTRDPARPNIYSVLIEGQPVETAILSTGSPGVDLLPSDLALAGAEIELISLPRRESRLLYALDGLKDGYEYIIIDCPPSLGLLTLNALVAARHLLVPIQCEFYALEALGHLAYTLDMVRQQSNPGLELAGIVMTLYDPRTTLSSQVVEEVRRLYPDVVFRTLIPRNVRLSEAPSYGLPIGQYSPRSRGGIAYADLTREVLARAGADAPPELVSISASVTTAPAPIASMSASVASASVPSAPAPASTGAVGPGQDPDDDVDVASTELESRLGAEAPEGIIDG
jgi:chromosome partitioning protein